MRRPLRPPVLLALLLLCATATAPPAARAQEGPALAYPQAALDLLPRWIDEADKAGRRAEGAPVSAQAQEYLEKAREAARAGRFRVALFDLETHHQLVETRRLLDEAAAQGAAPARQKDFLLQRDAALRAQALQDWEAFRARLHALDGELRSLHATELALYGADLALTAALQTTEAEAIRASVAGHDAVDEGLVAGLVRTSAGVSRSLAWAGDVVDLAAAQEGLPPRLDAQAWNATVEAARRAPEGETPAYLAGLERVAGSAREREEDLLAVALQLAMLRQARAAAILQQFGDAQARGVDVIPDATLGLRRGVENVSATRALEGGALGVFTADALDQARHVLSFARRGEAGLPTLAYAWAALEHQARAADVTAYVSGAGTRETPRDETPLGALPLLAAAAAGALLASRARTRRG